MSAPDPIAALLTRIASGDRRAFAQIYDAAGPKLFGTCLRILRDRGEAEDVLQEAMTRIWTGAHRFDPAKGRGMTWAIAVTRNLCIDRLRRRPMENRPGQDAGPAALEDLVAQTPTPEASLLAGDAAARLTACFGTLEADRAAAIRGAYLDGLTYEVLAARFAVPLNTMRSWLRRGVQKLKDCLGEGVPG